MPTETFFHLPEEKRLRLIDSARTEFIRVPYADTSINRIVQTANIPRGSFYQYFEDKHDLFNYLVCPLRQFFLGLLREADKAFRDDPLAASLRVYDRFFTPETQQDRGLAAGLQIIRRNPELGFGVLCPKPAADSPASRETETFHLFTTILVFTILDTVMHPEKQTEHRRQLQTRDEILMQGCCT